MPACPDPAHLRTRRRTRHPTVRGGSTAVARGPRRAGAIPVRGDTGSGARAEQSNRFVAVLRSHFSGALAALADAGGSESRVPALAAGPRQESLRLAIQPAHLHVAEWGAVGGSSAPGGPASRRTEPAGVRLHRGKFGQPQLGCAADLGGANTAEKEFLRLGRCRRARRTGVGGLPLYFAAARGAVPRPRASRSEERRVGKEC